MIKVLESKDIHKQHECVRVTYLASKFAIVVRPKLYALFSVGKKKAVTLIEAYKYDRKGKKAVQYLKGLDLKAREKEQTGKNMHQPRLPAD